MSQTQASETIEKHRNSMLRFLDSINPEALPDKGFQCYTIATTDSPRKIYVIPLDVVTKYWLEQAFKGNPQAQALTYACVTESLERRCDAVFKTVKTEDEYESNAETNYRDYWQSSRTFSKRCHVAFSHACWLLANN